MAHPDPALARSTGRQHRIGLAILAVIAVVGLFIVKWDPLYHKALLVVGSHSLGVSILSSGSNVPPPPSLASATSYLVTYFNAIWQALVLGMLLATTVETLLPRTWLVQVLGSRALRATMLGGVLALPGMM